MACSATDSRLHVNGSVRVTNGSVIEALGALASLPYAARRKQARPRCAHLNRRRAEARGKLMGQMDDEIHVFDDGCRFGDGVSLLLRRANRVPRTRSSIGQ
jgi:hypothetical protein